MKDLCFDVETTTYSKGSPFDRRNELVCIAFKELSGRSMVVRPDSTGTKALQEAIKAAECLVGFNLKFDLHWLRRLGVDFTGKRVYDCQAAEFILTGQTHKFPSLDDVAFKYLNERKIDEVKAFWDQGIQTTDIPWEILERYAAKDVDLTLSVARKQEDATSSNLKRLISLTNQDLLVLEEMEWNGIKFDRELAIAKGEKLELQIKELQRKHNVLHSVPNFNWGSPSHLSALLYGGTIKETIKVPVGHFKSGKNVGQVRYANEVKHHILPRIFKPPKGSEKAKDGFYSTDEDTLLELTGGNKSLLADLLEIRKMQKEISTYLYGLPKKQDEGCYTDYIYGQFNQCAAATGRLSSANPNLQNLSEEIGKCLMTRYPSSSISTASSKRL